ncbi:MAG: dephospho-CoA kinase [Rhizobiaceae bacterium]
MIIVGLTGSIAMGKSTTAQMFRDFGIPVHDADAVVHRLYEGKAVPLIENAFPGAVKEGRVDRVALSQQVLGKPEQLKLLESLIHPLVHAEERLFLEEAERNGEKIVILDIPLLFEVGGEKRVDVIVVVTADVKIQEQRALQRPGMTRARLAQILARQMPDAEKRNRADFLVDTSEGMDSARGQVRAIIDKLIESNQPITGPER